jgi:hypothetical protein
MAQTCTICKHPGRADIDKALVAGESYRSIAARFSVSESAVFRHRESHIPAAIMAAAGAEQIQQALDVMGQLKAINAASLLILNEARKAKDGLLALQAVDRVMKQVSFQSRLLTEAKEQAGVNFADMPEWHSLRSGLLEALRPFPEAAAAVAAALSGTEDTNALS